MPASELDGALSGSREDFVSCRHLEDFVSCRHLERGKARHQSPRWKVSCPVRLTPVPYFRFQFRIGVDGNEKSALHSVRRLLAQWAGFHGSPVGLDEHGDDGCGDETSSGLDEDCR